MNIRDKQRAGNPAINQMRESPDLPYHPTMSETITLAQLLTSGVTEKEALTMTLVDVYSQWGSDVVTQVSQLLHSRLGIKFGEPDKRSSDGDVKSVYMRVSKP